jgi:hypothetical protein
MSDVAQEVRGDAHEAEHSKTHRWLGRVGDGAYGVVHLVVAVLALQVAFGGSSGSGGELDQKGAVKAIAAQPFGAVLLWVLALGLFAFAIWQILTAALGFKWVTKKGKRTRRRIGAGGRAVVAIALGAFALETLFSGASSSGNSKQQELTARILGWPGGQVIVGAVAVGILAVAFGMGSRGVRRSFMQDLETQRLAPSTKTWVEVVGSIGFVAKGVAFGVIGGLLLTAAIEYDPKKAGGLDAALKTLAAQPFGVVLLVVVALGLAAYGVYCFIEGWYRKA